MAEIQHFFKGIVFYWRSLNMWCQNVTIIKQDMWCLYLNPVDYAIWGSLREHLYHDRKFENMKHLKQEIVLSQKFTDGSGGVICRRILKILNTSLTIC